MSEARIIPAQGISGVVTLEILVDGSVIAAEVQVLSIVTNKQVNRIPSATIVLRDGGAAEEGFPESDKALFMPGKSVEIKTGYDAENKTIFKGLIVRHAIRIRENGVATLTLECKDDAVTLSLGRKNKYFRDVKDSDVLTEILGALAGDIETTNGQHGELVQHHCTDWDFVVMRAEANAKLVLTDDGVVNVKAPKTEDPALHLIYGSTILELEAEMDARHSLPNVKATAWNYSKQELEESITDAADFDDLQGDFSAQALALVASPDPYELRHSGQLSAEEASTWAKAVMLKSRMAKIRGRAKFTGFSDLKPGQWLEIQGIGKRFEGRAFVSAVRHDISNGIWFTHAQFGIEPEWMASKPDVMDCPAGGLTAAVNGLQIGVCVQLENDPNGDDRILVKLPTLDSQDKGIWSRVMCLDAGNERGSFFRPEIGDEVLVGFVGGDPRDAVILGHLNSRAKPAPVSAKDDNHIKGFYTRSKMRLQFDDEKKIITIDTPGGNSMVIDEDDKSITLKDQNGNKIKMGTDGIEISSPKDIKVTASQKIEQKATMDMTLEGLNTTLKASANLSLNGQAAAALESSGVTQVKGSLLKLN